MSATKSDAGGAPVAPNSFFGRLWGLLSSVRFTIFLLSFVAVCCIAGTVVPQQATPEQYLSRYSDATYGLLKLFGLTDVFHAVWFLLAIGLFALNLVACTTNRLARLIKAERRTAIPNEKTVIGMPLKFLAPGKRIEVISDLFKGYRRTAVGTNVAAFERGSISKYGVYIIHGSILLILAGSLIGLTWGYRGFMTLHIGQTNGAITSRGLQGTVIPLGFDITCTDFKVAFYPNGEPKDYVSRIEITENGKLQRTADVRVNHPATYGGANIYQASYGTNAIFVFDVGGHEARLAQGETYKKGNLSLFVMRFQPSVHDFGPGVQIAYLDGDNPKAVWFLKNVPRLRERKIMDTRVELKDIIEEPYTGLEVARDPGVPVVWTGFALMLFGLFINFFVSNRKIYLLQKEDGVLVAGTSPKNKEAFREEFEQWREKVHGVAR